MNIVIVAGGLGSRLAPLTNHIPKFLVNIGKNTGYVEQIRYWLPYTNFEAIKHLEESGSELDVVPDTITVIVHPSYEKLVRAYHDMYFPDVPLIVKTVNAANGSAHAILSTCEHLIGKSVIFQWCDVMPAEDLPIDEMHEHYHGANVVFTNYDHPNRYGLVKKGTGWADVRPALKEDGRGGIFGMYYVNNFHLDVMYVDGQDFVEVIEQYSGGIREHRVSSIIDWGDMPKLDRTRDTADAAREFNSVEFQGNLVLKKALNDQGKTLMAREVEWYLTLDDLNSEVSRPEVWLGRDRASFVMSKVEGVPIFKLWQTLDADGRALVLTRIFEQMDKLHSTQEHKVTNDIVQRDVRLEACDKLMKRYDEIKDMIAAFGEVHQVNGYVLKERNPGVMISRLHQRLHNEYAETTEYSVIHGDLQMSNSMINPDTMEITLIDPRGYFGKTETYGLPDYDIAKLYYSLTGYDQFNYSREFHIRKFKDGEIEFEVPQPMLGGCEEIMKERFQHRHELWLAVIWLGLAGYIKNDPVKSLCAHWHGMTLADKLLNP